MLESERKASHRHDYGHTTPMSSLKKEQTQIVTTSSHHYVVMTTITTVSCLCFVLFFYPLRLVKFFLFVVVVSSAHQHEGTSTVLEVDESTTILEAALDNDIDLPHDCKLGVCLTCPSKVVSGEVDQSDGTLEDSVTALVGGHFMFFSCYFCSCSMLKVVASMLVVGDAALCFCPFSFLEE